LQMQVVRRMCSCPHRLCQKAPESAKKNLNLYCWFLEEMMKDMMYSITHSN
jgi:hypothetical protein